MKYLLFSLLFVMSLSCDVDKIIQDNKEDIKDLTDWMNYGQWCGPYNDEKFKDGTPVDDIDMCCKSHDLAYREIVKSGGKIHVALCQGDEQEDADNTLVECVESLPEDMYQWEKMPADMIKAEFYIEGIRGIFGWCE